MRTVVGGGRDTHDGHENSPILVFFSNLLEFYQRLFDMTVYTRQDSGNIPIMTIGSGPQFVALSQTRNAGPTVAGAGHHFCVHIEHFDPGWVLERLADLGIEARIFP